MESIAVLYVTALLVAAFSSAALATYAWKNKRVHGARPLATLLAGAATWSLGYGLEIWAAQESVKIFWAKFQYFGILCIPAAWLIFTLQFAGWRLLQSRKQMLWLLPIPAVTLALVWTNELHHLIWSSYPIADYAGIRLLHLEHGPFFYIISLYSHLLVVFGGIVVLQTYLRSRHAYRRQAGMILAAASFPWVANLVYVFHPHFLIGLDLTPFAFVITGGISAWSLFRSGFLNLLPIARYVLFEKMSDGVLVLDASEQVQDLNQAAADILGKSPALLVGEKAAHLGPIWAETIQRATNSTSSQSGEPLNVIVCGSARVYLPKVIPIHQGDGQSVGSMVLWTDVTARRQAEAVLRRQLLETQALNTVAQACVNIQDEDILITHITQIIGETLYSKNFGLLLFDERENVLRFHPSYIGIPDEIKLIKIPLTRGITGKVASSGQPVRFGNVTDVPEYTRFYQKTQSELCAPLRIGDRLIGVINIESEEPDAFSESDERLVVTLAGQITTAIDRLRADAAERRRLREISLLSKVISATASAKDLTSALAQVCRDVAHYFQSPQAGFALIDYQNAEARVVAEYQEADRPSALGMVIPLQGNPSMEHILRTKAPLAVEDAQNDSILAPIHEIMRARGVASILIAPILVADEVAGTLGVDYYERRVFEADDLRLIQDVASQVGQAIERMNLYSAVQTRAAQLERLAQVSAGISRSFTYDQVVRNICQGAMRLSDTHRSTLYARSSDGEVLCAWHTGLSPSYIQQVIQAARLLPGGRLFASQDPVLIADIDAVPEGSLIKALARQEGFRAYALWPLVYEGAVVAAVGCYFDEPMIWTDTHVEIMTTYARQCAIALKNSHLFDETRQRASQLEALNKIVSSAAAAASLPELLSKALALAIEALEAPYGVVWTDEHVSVWGLPQDFIQHAEATLPAHHAQMGSTVVIEDWQELSPEDPAFLLKDLHLQAGLRSSIYVPLVSQGNRIGGLVIHVDTLHAWRKEEILLLESIGGQLGSAAERLGLLEKIQAQADQMQRILDTVPEGVLLLDQKLQLVLANPAAQRYLDLLSSQCSVGRVVENIGDSPIHELLAEASTWCEIETQTPNKLIFDVFAQPLRVAPPQSGWVLVLRDLTEERNTQTRLQTQDRLATVGQLAAGIAHDFNNIMAAISVYADLLLMEPGISRSAHERLEIIQRQVLRASSLIRQILDFSRRSVLEHSQMDLLPFIKELDKLLARVIPENIRIELKYQPGSYLVNADPTRLQQVFMNLALNSRDAMPDGGILGFELGHHSQETEGSSMLPELEPGKWVVIRVWDTGKGIPPESLEHIFEPFFTTKPVGKGTGLGLAQVYGIVKQHGGCIDVRSQVNRGTSFTIYLPELAPAPVASQVPAKQIETSGNGETILIVEDDNAARHALQSLLQTYNYQVFSAENGVKALKILQDQAGSIDLVISDMVMPEIGGMELYRRLSKDGTPWVKFIFITGHPMDEESQVLLEAGNVRWLQKPFSAGELTSLIRYQLLEQH